jgi:hypothetical protein
MAVVAVLTFSERLEAPGPPRWRWRGFGKLGRIAVAQARIRLRANYTRQMNPQFLPARFPRRR